MKTLEEMFENIKIKGGIKKRIVASLLNKIEEARNTGYKLNEIYEELNKRGLNTSFDNFRKILSDIKKERKNKKTKKVAIVNFKDEVEKLTIANLLDLSKKDESREWIIYDTLRSTTDEVLSVIGDVDYIIIPFTKGNRSKEIINTIKSLLEIMDNNKVKFTFVFNIYQDNENIEKKLESIKNEVKK